MLPPLSNTPIPLLSPSPPSPPPITSLTFSFSFSLTPTFPQPPCFFFNGIFIYCCPSLLPHTPSLSFFLSRPVPFLLLILPHNVSFNISFP